MEKTSQRDPTKRTQKDYSLAFKLQIIEEIEKGLLSYEQAQKKYGMD